MTTNLSNLTSSLSSKNHEILHKHTSLSQFSRAYLPRSQQTVSLHQEYKHICPKVNETVFRLTHSFAWTTTNALRQDLAILSGNSVMFF